MTWQVLSDESFFSSSKLLGRSFLYSLVPSPALLQFFFHTSFPVDRQFEIAEIYEFAKMLFTMPFPDEFLIWSDLDKVGVAAQFGP